MFRKEISFFLPALGVAAIDQLSKLWIRANLILGQSLPQDSPIRLTYVLNEGAVFGLGVPPTVIFVFGACLIIFLILLYRSPWVGRTRWIWGIILGGAFGNLIDRLHSGYVTDFIDVRVWPVFNLADSAMVIGSCLLILFLLRGK